MNDNEKPKKEVKPLEAEKVGEASGTRVLIKGFKKSMEKKENE